MTTSEATPARLYCLLAGGTQVLLGIAGFFANAEFPGRDAAADPENQGELLGLIATNGWHNVAGIALGLTGLVAARYAARTYALVAGGFLTALGAFGFVTGETEGAISWLAVNTADNFLHTALGLPGVLAGLASPGRGPSARPRVASAGPPPAL
jgi:hypothetical protein